MAAFFSQLCDMFDAMKRVALLLFLTTGISSQDISHDFLNLHPRKSTRQDVEKLFGAPTRFDSKNSIAHYDIPKGSLSVFYGLGKCDPNRRWNVSVDMTVEAQFHFEDGSEPQLSEYAVVTKGFDRFAMKGYKYFTALLISPDKSIIFAVKQTKSRGALVTSIYLSPAKSEWDKYCK